MKIAEICCFQLFHKLRSSAEKTENAYLGIQFSAPDVSASASTCKFLLIAVPWRIDHVRRFCPRACFALNTEQRRTLAESDKPHALARVLPGDMARRSSPHHCTTPPRARAGDMTRRNGTQHATAQRARRGGRYEERA